MTAGDEGVPARFTDTVQTALGVVSARRRGDDEAAELLLSLFVDDRARAAAFFVLAELSLELLRERSGRTWEELGRDLSVAVAAAAR